MKTTVEISDALLMEAKKVAAREGTTVRTLIEQGLRHTLAGRGRRGGFKLRKASFKGRGLSAGARGASWQRLREIGKENNDEALHDRRIGQFLQDTGAVLDSQRAVRKSTHRLG